MLWINVHLVMAWATVSNVWPISQNVATGSYPSAANGISAVLSSRRLRRPDGLLTGLHPLLSEALHLGLWTAGMSRWTPLFPPHLHGWYGFFRTSRLNAWILSSPNFLSFVTCRHRAVDKHPFRIASLWKRWCKNRQLSNRKQRKTRIYSSFVFLTCRWHPPEDNI